jgi:hypothetical protein
MAGAGCQWAYDPILYGANGASARWPGRSDPLSVAPRELSGGLHGRPLAVAETVARAYPTSGQPASPAEEEVLVGIAEGLGLERRN